MVTLHLLGNVTAVYCFYTKGPLDILFVDNFAELVFRDIPEWSSTILVAKLAELVGVNC